ncbi:MAG: DcaP family trimeric outer membrane transporter [Bacteroidales bacterium]
MKKGIVLSIISILLLNIYAMGQETKSPFLYEKGNTSVKFDGFVRLNAFVDFGGSIPNNNFRNSLIPVPNSWDNDSRFTLDPSQTRMRFSVIQKTASLGDIEFCIETDFRGASNVLRLRQAYISFKGFILGQTWGFMYDPSSQAPTVDTKGANSRTHYRAPLIGYRVNLDENFTFGVSIEHPSVKMSGQPGVKSINQSFPDIPLYLQYKGEGGHIKLAAVFRSMNYGVIEREKVETELGIGAQLSGSLDVSKNFSLYSHGIYGKGVAKYINDLALLSLDLVPKENGATEQAVKMYGISIGAKANINKKLYCSATVSNAGLVNNDDYFSANEYFTGSYYSGSLFWTGIKNMTIAGTYIHGTRKNMNNIKGDANRILVMIMYKW